mgnify:CR=1 FL=1
MENTNKMKQYDYLIVGSGLFGATFAYLAKKQGKKCLVIDKRSHLGGNIYCENIEGINVHKYGAHIFHTSSKKVWDLVNSIVEFNRYTNSPVANYKGKLYNLPFNMNTFYQMWGVTTPEEAQTKIDEQKAEAVARMQADGVTEPRNLEEQAQVLIGKDIYEKLIKGYTEKQWGRKCTDLPAFIIKRLPVRLFFENRPYWEGIADKIVFTGKIDEFYGYQFGKLNYRTVRFETELIEKPNYQGNAVVNYTEREIPYTRVIEHKHFEMFGQGVYETPKTVISKEFSTEWKDGMEPYYPVNDEVNSSLYAKYKALANKEDNVIFGGRLAEYKYYDMAPTVERAMEWWNSKE